MQTAIPQKPAAPQSRMKLASVQKGKQQRPFKIVLTGVEGIGKSTFAASAPSVVFLDAESGSAHLDVSRFPTPQSWEDVKAAIVELTTSDHPFKTLVVDTVDHIEPLLWAHCVRRDTATSKTPLNSIEDYGYGKGYVVALDEWRVFVRLLENLIVAKAMNVILVGHVFIKNFKNPEGPDYDRYTMKLHEKAAGLLREWADDVLFANHDIATNTEKGTKRTRGISSGQRFMFTTHSAAYDAKNRHNLPEQMTLDWAEFVAACGGASEVSAADLRAAIDEKLPQLAEKHQIAVKERLKTAGDDLEVLTKLNGWVNTKVIPAAKAA